MKQLSKQLSPQPNGLTDRTGFCSPVLLHRRLQEVSLASATAKPQPAQEGAASSCGAERVRLVLGNELGTECIEHLAWEDETAFVYALRDERTSHVGCEHRMCRGKEGYKETEQEDKAQAFVLSLTRYLLLTCKSF